MPDGGPPIDETRAYFRGINSALTALERRLEAKTDLSGDDALREIRRYRQVVLDNLTALEQIEER